MKLRMWKTKQGNDDKKYFSFILMMATQENIWRNMEELDGLFSSQHCFFFTRFGLICSMQLRSDIFNSLPHCPLGDLNEILDKKCLKLILATDGSGIFCEITLRWMLLHLTDDKSTLDQVMAWCRQATSYYLSQCWPRSMLLFGDTRSQHIQLPADALAPVSPGHQQQPYLQCETGSLFSSLGI